MAIDIRCLKPGPPKYSKEWHSAHHQGYVVHSFLGTVEVKGIWPIMLGTLEVKEYTSINDNHCLFLERRLLRATAQVQLSLIAEAFCMKKEAQTCLILKLQEPEQLPIVCSFMLNIARIPYTSNIPQHDFYHCLGPVQYLMAFELGQVLLQNGPMHYALLAQKAAAIVRRSASSQCQVWLQEPL